MNAFLSFFIGSEPWCLDPSLFIEAFRLRWPTVELKTASTRKSVYTCTWTFAQGKEPSEFMEGYLSRDCDQIDLRGTVSTCIGFAKWLRQLVPTHVSLIISDDQHGDSVEVYTDLDLQRAMDYFDSDP